MEDNMRVRTHPGEVLREEFMVPLELSANALAREIDVPANRITSILDDRHPRSVTANTAIRLARYLGTTPQFWLNLQSDYELSLALKEKGSEIQNKVRPRAASALDPLPEQTCGREKEAATTSEAYSELEVHDWVPSGIADLARSLHKIGSANLARPFPTEGYALLVQATQRLVNERVWEELRKRQRDAGRDYVYTASEHFVRAHPHYRSAIKGRSQKPNERDRLQEEACMLLFSVATGSCLDIPGLRIRPTKEVKEEEEAHRDLGQRLKASADTCRELGYGQFAEKLCAMAGYIHDQSILRQSVMTLRDGEGRGVRNPLIVDRERSDRTLVKLVRELVLTCRCVFRQDLPGIVARIAGAALGQKLTEATVRGIAKGIHGPRT
jgi:addiction module HigA family antidote